MALGTGTDAPPVAQRLLTIATPRESRLLPARSDPSSFGSSAPAHQEQRNGSDRESNPEDMKQKSPIM